MNRQEDRVAGIVARVRQIVAARVAAIPLSDSAEREQLVGGKMLRTRLAVRVSLAAGMPNGRHVLEEACASLEMVHTASLCHDDLIDGGSLRRGSPALWRVSGPAHAVLVGDFLFCGALDLLARSAGARYCAALTQKIMEICAAEAEAELLRVGRPVEEATYLRLARSKTGPLFAFAASLGAADTGRVREALEEAGYCLGTAYQLADDLVDLVGSEAGAGKTLGGDSRSGRFTLPHSGPKGAGQTVALTKAHVAAALTALEDWPELRQGFVEFLERDVMPALRKAAPRLEIELLNQTQ